MLLQSVQQTGPPSQRIERESHLILAEASFGHAMLRQLETGLERIRMNSQSWRSAATFSLLARRVLSFASALEVRVRAIDFLVDMHTVCHAWLRALTERAAVMPNESLEIALLCISTYDVEEADVATILQRESAISILLQSSIVIQEKHGAVLSEHPDLFNVTLRAWNRLMYRLLPTLRTLILKDSSGLSEAITANWFAFEPTSPQGWQALPEHQEHWLHTKSLRSGSGSGYLPVHFNLLTGELLVNGLPLDRLPSEYMRHIMYAPLFGKSTLEVVPTGEPGLRFSAKMKHKEYNLHFGMSGDDMLLLAIGHGKKLELLPSRLFQGLLPQSLVTDAVHFYDSEAQEVIFQPLYSPWPTEIDAARWRLVRHASSWRLVKGETIMIDVNSYTARTIAAVLAPLEKPLHMHIHLLDPNQTPNSRVEIELPRLQIAFDLDGNDNHLRSRQYRNMIVDPDQTMGTLVGLQSRLILRSTENRMVLIPHGLFDFAITSKIPAGPFASCNESISQHTTVRLVDNSATRIRAYHMDETLGQIDGDGSMQSRLMLCYLHALTSHYLPDPLTGCTGTESAISILRSAAVRSIDLFTSEDLDLLARIADLSGARIYYPAHLQEMQTTRWDARLPSLAHHPSFRILVSGLLEQAARMQVFHPDKYVMFQGIQMAHEKLLESSNSDLDKRSAVRTATYRVASFGAEEWTSSLDVQYAARDIQLIPKRGERAYVIASLILRNQFALHNPIPDLKSVLVQKHIASATVHGVDNMYDLRRLGYDSKWLGVASEHIKEAWCSLQEGLTGVTTYVNHYNLATWLSTMAFADNADFDVIQALALFYRSPQAFSSVQPPAVPEFDLAWGHDFQDSQITATLRLESKQYGQSAEASLPKLDSETKRQHRDRKKQTFEDRKDNAIQGFVSSLSAQWPVQSPTTPSATEYTTYLNVSKSMAAIRIRIEHWYNNRQFMDYLAHVSTVIAHQPASSVAAPRHVLTLPPQKGYIGENIHHYNALDIFAAAPPPTTGLVPPCEPQVTIARVQRPENQSDMSERLSAFCEHLMTGAKSVCEQEYVETLLSSCIALDAHVANNSMRDELLVNAQSLLHGYMQDCQKHIADFNFALKDHLSSEVGVQIQFSPRIHPKFWLNQLHRDCFDNLSYPWQETVIKYALAITNLQRAQRLFRLSNNLVDLLDELRHVGHSNWDVYQYPETLLMEAESGMLVRKEQEHIASYMRSPKDGHNAVLQLLMGGGKSTTILPILSAFHGDKKKLVRVIVGKPQSKQMLTMLIAKLGGLLNRKIYQLPFSRNLRLSAQDANIIHEIYKECVRERGVLLAQPEHILSSRLMAVECVLVDESETAQSLLATQKWLDDVSCDCIDESDEVFSTKFESVYTMGTQRAIDYAPERWLIIQEVLALIPNVAKRVKEDLPEVVDIQSDGDGMYPRIRFLRTDAADRIVYLLATRVVESGIGTPSRTQSPAMQAAILHYISVSELEAHEIKAVEESMFWTETTKPAILLLRGLFAGGILRFVFQKRYRVDFGLDSHRTPSTRLAVPFRSKDAPSPRSEFSHEDVVIVLTQLSYYSKGLGEDDLFETLTHLLKSDQAVIHYDEIVSTASSSLPKAFRHLSGVSIRNRDQCIAEVFSGLRHSRKAIDYYLSYLVFPKEMKHFPQKISASGWDLAGTNKVNASTGFSGTNDTLHLLPLDIKHLDLPSQQHTNAEVLSFLLMDETSVANLPARAIGSTG